ncbi:MAG: UPF0175 family protein, partial [Balneolales bacterium]|nr:UPF0175 family protein [Balneolales bacterium]
MKAVQINIPDSVTLDETELTLMFASFLYQKGELSQGQAAEMAGVSRRTFLENLHRFGVSVFNYPPEDLLRELN